jgi:two-component sensor histidine kinase/ligand-binding sensor domain-containing protein
MLSTVLISAVMTAALLPSSKPSLDPEKAVSQFVLDSWTMEDGLPQNTVRTIWQTDDGYLWLGTQAGLVRFNGLEFKVFDTDPAFSSVNIISMGEDSQHRLWVGTLDGIVIVDGGVPSPLGQLPPRTQVSAFLPDAGDGMWVGTWTSGMYHCTIVQCAQIGPQDIGEVQSIVGAAGATWVGTDAGVFELEPGGRVVPLGGPDLLSVSSMVQDKDNRLVIATRDPERVILLGPDRRLEYLDAALGWPTDRVRSLLLDRSGSLWMGLQTDGVIRFVSGIGNRFREENELPVLALFEDREGSIWVGTEGAGLLRFRDGAFTTIDSGSGLSEDYVTTLFQDESGRVWAGTLGGGVDLIDPETIEVLETAKGLPSQNVTGVSGNKAGTVWVASIDAGVAEIRGGIVTPVGPLPSESVYAIHVDSMGDLWIGTDQGLAYLSDGQMRTLTVEDGLGSNSIVSIEDNGEGTVWVGTYGGGLTEFRDGKARTFGTDDGLGSDIVSALHYDSDGVLWIGTIEGGLSLLVDDRIRTYSIRDGLWDDTVFQILEDDLGFLWMGSNKGITRVRKEAVHQYSSGILEVIPHESFGTDDGLKSAEINGGTGPAGWKSADGRLWFPTVAGVAVVDPMELSRNTAEPPVVIERIAADGVPVSGMAEVAFRPGTRRIDFKFAALSLVDAAAVQYRYRIEPDEAEWTSATSVNTATYTFLKPGHHTFRVRASNNDGIWNEEGASLSFYLRPYVYQTRWFWMLIASCGFLAGAYAVRARTRQLKFQRVRLESMVADRTRDVMAAKDQIQAQSDALRSSLREKEVLLREVHHRVKNNLQMISSLLQLQAQQVDDPDTKIRFAECRDRIYSFSMVHERLYMAKDMARFDFVEYLNGLANQLVRSLEFGHNNIQLSVNVDAVEINVDRAIQCGLIATELITNALRHGFEHGQSGTVLLEFRAQDSDWLLLVEDDGRGLAPDFEANSHDGLGLKLVDALVSRLRGTLQSGSGTVGGTRFEVRFPMSDHILPVSTGVEAQVA